MKNNKMGAMVFIVGLVIAILISLFSANLVPAWAVFTLAVIGLIVGIVNINSAETNLFLVAGIAFIISFQSLSDVIEALAFGWDSVGTFFALLNVFLAPAVAIVALKALFGLAKD